MRRTISLLGAVLVVLVGAVAAPAAAAAGPTPATAGRMVVKVDVLGGRTIASAIAGLPVRVESAVLASRGIYLLVATEQDYDGDGNPKDALTGEDDRKLASDLGKRPGVLWTELDQPITLTDTRRVHGWPNGTPGDSGTDAAVFTSQPVVSRLNLTAAHARSQGTGVLVAVLDTGADVRHPALAGRTVAAWDYVGDDGDVADVAEGSDSSGDGVPDAAVGHGTFVSGMVALVAPQARILPARVLDSDGIGNTFVVAEAIVDAVDAGARVINLSFGTSQAVESKVLEDALKVANERKVVVVGAAGNTGSSVPHFPASASKVCGVGALGADHALASYSNWGDWVEVAAPGDALVGPMPGGGYASWSGSSMSSGLVSGQAALIRAVRPKADANSTIDIIKATARRLPGVHSGSIDVPRSLERALS